jgi:hypothetical protein
MKKNTQTGIILCLIYLSISTFGQSMGSDPTKIKNIKISQENSLDFVFNIVGTNLNYGLANSSLVNYKKPALGVQVGLSFQAGVTQHFSVVSEFYFIMKGGKLDADNPLTTGKTTYRLYTFELPILARFHFGKVHINAGPSIAHNFYGTTKIDNPSKKPPFDNLDESFKHLEIGIQLGGGYTFKTKLKTVKLDARYCHGLTNISNNHEMYNKCLIISMNVSKHRKNKSI